MIEPISLSVAIISLVGSIAVAIIQLFKKSNLSCTSSTKNSCLNDCMNLSSSCCIKNEN